jgi:hypothetical protein
MVSNIASSDDETVYSLVSGEHPEAVFTGQKNNA